MTETKFEVGKTYPLREGGIGAVQRTGVHPDGREMLIVTFVAKGGASGCGVFEIDGRWDAPNDHPYDLLPAIEPEGAAAGMHPKVRQALVAMADLWGAFCGDIQTGLVDPCGGECFQLDGARIACGYESREAALTECRQIIESIDSLLEGGPAK